jgi:hypothetical protein
VVLKLYPVPAPVVVDHVYGTVVLPVPIVYPPLEIKVDPDTPVTHEEESNVMVSVPYPLIEGMAPYPPRSIVES